MNKLPGSQREGGATERGATGRGGECKTAMALAAIGFKRGTNHLTLRHPVSALLLSTYLRVAAQAIDSIALSSRHSEAVLPSPCRCNICLSQQSAHQYDDVRLELEDLGAHTGIFSAVHSVHLPPSRRSSHPPSNAHSAHSGMVSFGSVNLQQAMKGPY